METRRGIGVVGIVGVAGLLACGDKTAPPAASASASSALAQAHPPGSAAPVAVNDEIKSIYPTGEPPDPLAETYCRAVHERVAERKKECCGPAMSAASLKDECVRMLSYAIRSGSVAADAPAIETCARDVGAATEGCAWVSSSAITLPASCRRVIRGKLAAGTNCRSSLECSDGLACHGIAATKMGVCGPPRPEGSVCGLGIDPLIAMMVHEVDPVEHAECQGACSFRKCVPRSSAPLPGLDAPCASDACALGLRCVDGVCRSPGQEGASCKTDRACLGTCESGACKRGCPKPFALPKQETPPTSSAAPPR